VIAIDTSVLVDLIGDGPGAAAAEDTIRDALAHGPVVACDVVVGEVVAGLGFGSELTEAMEAAGIGYSATEARAAVRAGEMQRRYEERLREAGRPPLAVRSTPDFLIGAHALLQCQGLITRDAGFFRDYFKGLRVIAPGRP
jgi:predicted nucleic acid-binding protein